MPYPKQNYFQRRTRSFGARANHYIKAREVQVISSEVKNYQNNIHSFLTLNFSI